mmetsp:Transcript_26688/g.78572  ORF Transcript_26688/g.78572 Transcript_26688/m.78572 type:complete len:225 (+) Transcript_26688:669-1343(+)
MAQESAPAAGHAQVETLALAVAPRRPGVRHAPPAIRALVRAARFVRRVHSVRPRGPALGDSGEAPRILVPSVARERLQHRHGSPRLRPPGGLAAFPRAGAAFETVAVLLLLVVVVVGVTHVGEQDGDDEVEQHVVGHHHESGEVGRRGPRRNRHRVRIYVSPALAGGDHKGCEEGVGQVVKVLPGRVLWRRAGRQGAAEELLPEHGEDQQRQGGEHTEALEQAE